MEQLKNLTDIQLKAIAYDTLSLIQEKNRLLEILNQEIQSRALQAQQKKNMEETKVEEVIDAPATPEETTEEVAE